MRILCMVCILLALSAEMCLADSWWGILGTNTSSFAINRESTTFSMRSEEALQGQISSVKVTPQGRTISGYHSRYANIQDNDVMLKERTNARDGSLVYAEITEINASAENVVTNEIDKPAGQSQLIDKFMEQWPVVLVSDRYLRYSGAEINDRDFGGNNMDYVGTTYLYNTQLEQSRIYQAILQRLNLSVVASVKGGLNDSIDSVEYLANKMTRYRVTSNSTGIAELKFGQASSEQLSMIRGHINYDNKGDLRYNGNVQLNAIYNSTLMYNEATFNDTWLNGICEGCEATRDMSIDPVSE